VTRAVRLSWLVIVPALAGCTAGVPTGAPSPGGPTGPDALAQVGQWTLQGASDADGRRVDAAFPHGTALHGLAFAGGRVQVTGGCNAMSGTYRIDAAGRLVVGALAATKRACADPALMAADAEVADLVEGAAAWRIAESWPEQLFLDHDDGARTQWRAVRAD
jgi:heat shock protein HslJ